MKQHALVIGNSRYLQEREFPTIKYTENDARRVFQLLTNSPTSLFTKQTSKLEVNCSHTQFNSLLSGFFQHVNRSDFVLFYYAGHARVIAGKMLFLAMADTKPDNLSATGFCIDGLIPYLEERQITRYVVILDCCRAGVALNAPGIRHRGLINSTSIPSYAGKGKVFIASAHYYQLAYEMDKLRHGLFSNYLVRGIETGEAASTTDQFINITQLFDYIKLQMSEIHRDISQEPVLSGQDQSGQLIIAKNPNYKPLEPLHTSIPDTMDLLLNRCKKQIESEITSTVGDKFLPALYIDRDNQEQLHYFLSDRLTKALEKIEPVFRLVSDTTYTFQHEYDMLIEELDDLEEVSSRADHESLNKLREAIEHNQSLNHILIKLKSLMRSHSPSIHQITETLNEIKSHQACTSSIQEIIDSALHMFKSCLIVIDAAGRGKTNLACALALKRVETQPTIFIAAGALFLNDKYDLERYIQNSLGYSNQMASSQFIEHIANLSRLNNKEILLIVDAINENLDIRRIRVALQNFIARYCGLNFKFILTCRDIYWHGFLYQEEDEWDKFTFTYLHLGEFTEREFSKVSKLYFDKFRLSVLLSEEAKEKLKQPILLRFFCEAYHEQGRIVDLGFVQDIKLKPLFDTYWDSKVSSVRAKLQHRNAQHVEHLLLAIADLMRHKRKRTLTLDQITQATGLRDFNTKDSPYTLLLDERVILEQIRSRSGWKRSSVAFVYEEFMEYAMARELTRSLLSIKHKKHRRKKLLQVLADAEYFTNIFGMLTFLLPMLEQEGNYSAWGIVLAQGEKWYYPLSQALLRCLPQELGEEAFRVAVDLAKRTEDILVKERIVEFSQNLSVTTPHRAVPILQILLEDEVARIRLPARHCLVQLINKDEIQAENVLRDALAHRSSTVRGTSLYALAAIRLLSVEDLKPLVTDKDNYVREAAIYALGRVRDLSDVQTIEGWIENALKDNYPAVRYVAAIVSSKKRFKNLVSPKIMLNAKDREQMAYIQNVLKAILRNREKRALISK